MADQQRGTRWLVWPVCAVWQPVDDSTVVVVVHDYTPDNENSNLLPVTFPCIAGTPWCTVLSASRRYRINVPANLHLYMNFMLHRHHYHPSSSNAPPCAMFFQPLCQFLEMTEGEEKHCNLFCNFGARKSYVPEVGEGVKGICVGLSGPRHTAIDLAALPQNL